jgi:hypothetical protein
MAVIGDLSHSSPTRPLALASSPGVHKPPTVCKVRDLDVFTKPLRFGKGFRENLQIFYLTNGSAVVDLSIFELQKTQVFALVAGWSLIAVILDFNASESLPSFHKPSLARHRSMSDPSTLPAMYQEYSNTLHA